MYMQGCHRGEGEVLTCHSLFCHCVCRRHCCCVCHCCFCCALALSFAVVNPALLLLAPPRHCCQPPATVVRSLLLLFACHCCCQPCCHCHSPITTVINPPPPFCTTVLVAFMGASWGVSIGDMGRTGGGGGLPWSSLPLSTMVICVGHPLRLVMGVWSCVRHFRGACHCQ